MRLAKLHINGFKSFPDRSELGFDHGVTAIVGPNGCGKSNVVDAITWVLGEQSAKSLRGERMEDIIFNGSDARRPTAAAEVRLKLTHVAKPAMEVELDPLTALDVETPIITRDVEIGRRLYRSGESEYLIDGEVCRLRDVHDLLMDSGLGVKAYAVIEQGKIGQILSSRPAERRMLIEEAAGVTKYKSRRHAAELKLAAAQQNLTRIDDIIFEIDKQRNALKRQAARARRYKRLREEMRRWEQVQFAHRYETLAREIEAVETQLADARAKDAAAAAHVAELEAMLEKVRLELTDAETGATTARERGHAVELEIGRRQQQVQFETQQVEELARQAEAFDAEVGELEERREPARRAIETQRTTAAQARESLDASGRRVDAAEADYASALAESQRSERDADETRAAVLGAGTALSALRQARENAAAVRDRVAAERSRLDVELRELRAEHDATRSHHGGGAENLRLRKLDLENTIQRREEAEQKVARLRQERDAMVADRATRQHELAARSARRQSLEELDATRATFGDAAKYLLTTGAAATGGGGREAFHGAVADHLEVDRTFERAVDALLGDLLQHVVVDRIEDVRAALDALKDQNLGRCGFVVLDTERKDPAPTSMSLARNARPLRTVVRATGLHADRLSRLIGEALIVETFDDARRLALDTGLPVAAMTGEVFRGASRVEGGARVDARGILELRGETQQLADEVQALEAAIGALTASLAAHDAEISLTDASLSSLTSAQHEYEKEIVGLDGVVSRAAEDLDRVMRRLDVVTTERRRAEEEERAAEERGEAAAAAITEHEAQKALAEGRLGGVLEQLQRARADAEATMRRVTEARTEQATLAERVAALDVEAQRLEDLARDLDERVANRRADILRTEVRRGELRTSIAEAERVLDESVLTLQQLKTELRDLDERLTELRGQFSARDHDIRNARQSLELIRSVVMQSEVVRARAASDLAHLEEACREAVSASLDEVVAAVAEMERAGELAAPSARLAAAVAEEDEESEPSAEAGAAAAASEPPPASFSPENVILNLKRKIERLGPVNMMAIEQFDELESRHTFLTTQRKDLLDSIGQTSEAIRKIEKTTRERFEEAFARINEHFVGTFTTLFGGGRAGLVLIDQENEAESGIDIIAQPPGKRLQNVQLLSGGEKALTAMALMFAVFKYRPSPFCLLDEIDAPLDDANIGRFVEMLQGMQTHTQFILITHNRKTMEIADRMYGVTMEEPGVSKLISLQLN